MELVAEVILKAAIVGLITIALPLAVVREAATRVELPVVMWQGLWLVGSVGMVVLALRSGVLGWIISL